MVHYLQLSCMIIESIRILVITCKVTTIKCNKIKFIYIKTLQVNMSYVIINFKDGLSYLYYDIHEYNREKET